MFTLIIVEHFLLCVVCAHKSVATSVRAKEKQKHFSTECGTVLSLKVVTSVSY